MADRMFNLSRLLNAERGCVEPEGLSLALWMIAHRDKPVKKESGGYETAEDVARRLDAERKKVKG
jgi:hypothetical protein